MQLCEFENEVVKRVRGRLSDGAFVKSTSVTKSNDIKLLGLIIRAPGENVAPTIYLNSLYTRYLEEAMTMEDVVDCVLQSYREHQVKQSINLEWFKDFEYVKTRISFRLVNTDMNKEYLRDKPHKEFLDLSVVFDIRLSMDAQGEATVIVLNEHLTSWDVTLDQVYRQALENAVNMYPYAYQSMSSVIEKLLSDSQEEELLREILENDSQLYVLSSSRTCYGAAVILYPNVLANIAEEVGADLIILPSSIHEVLILSASQDVTKDDLYQMVKDVNDTQVAYKDILSYSVYHFSRETAEITIL